MAITFYGPRYAAVPTGRAASSAGLEVWLEHALRWPDHRPRWLADRLALPGRFPAPRLARLVVGILGRLGHGRDLVQPCLMLTCLRCGAGWVDR